MGNLVFLVKMPSNNQSKTISKVHGHEICVFGHWKGFGIFKTVTSLDTYQITNCSDSKKKIFFYLTFKEFEKEFSNQQFLDKNIILSK